MYNTHLIVNSPVMAGRCICTDCHMTFNNPQLLAKHKSKFCVGSTGDPHDLQLRRGFRSTSPPRLISPDDKDDDRESTILEDKLNEIKKFKDNRAMKRDLNDLEERLLLDKLHDAEQAGMGTPTNALRSKTKMPLSKYKDIRNLQLEYEKQRELTQPKASEIQIIGSPRGGGTPRSRQSNSSMSVYLDDDYRRNPNQDLQLRNLAEQHGKQMEYLQLRNRDLEEKRKDIMLKIEGLGRKSVPPVFDNTQELMNELRQQELRNQRNIDELKRQLMDMNRNPQVNVVEVEKPVYPMMPPPQQPLPNPPSPEPKKNFVFPIFYGGKSLVAEICAIRQAYLQNGGNDPEVLAQMAQMQAEAQAIEDQMNREPEKRPREKPKDGFGQLSFLELENERLKQELHLLQEQNLLAQQRRKSDKEDELQRELQRLQSLHLDKMYGLQKELDDLRMLLMMERNRPPPPQPPPPTTIVHQQQPQPPVSLKPYVEVEPMAPYDQYTNRFDKRQITTATRAWVATQFTKHADRPFYPIYPDEVEAVEEQVSYHFPNHDSGQYVRPPVHYRADTSGQKSAEPLALDYHPANTRPPYLVQLAEENNQERKEEYFDALDRNQFAQRSEGGPVIVPRSKWGQAVE